MINIVFIYALSEAISRGLSFAFFPLLARLYSSSDFRRIALLSSIGLLIGLVANFGLTNAAHRYYLDKPSSRIKKKKIVSTGFFLITILAIICITVSSVFLFFTKGSFTSNQVVESTAIVLFSVIPSQLVQYCQDIIRLHFSPWKYLFISVTKTLLGIIFCLVFIVHFNLGLQGYFLGLLCGYLLSLPFAILAIRHELMLVIDKDLSRNMMKYSYPFIFVGLGQWLMSSADLFILGRLRDASELGVYSAAIRIATIVMFFTTAFSMAWAPNALRLHAKNSNYRDIIGNMLPHFGSFLIFMSAIIGIFSRELVTWLTPIEYHSATILVCFLTISAAILGTVQITMLGMAFEKRSDLIAKAVWLCAFIGVCLSLIFTWFFGGLGTAIANMITSLLLTSCYLYLTQSIHPLTIDYKLIFRLFVFTIIALITSLIWLKFGISLNVFFAKVGSILLLLIIGYFMGFQLPFIKSRK